MLCKTLLGEDWLTDAESKKAYEQKNHYFCVIFKYEAIKVWTTSVTANGEYFLLPTKKIQASKNPNENH